VFLVLNQVLVTASALSSLSMHQTKLLMVLKIQIGYYNTERPHSTHGILTPNSRVA